MFIQAGVVKIFYGFLYGPLHFSEINADAYVIQSSASHKNLHGPVMSVHLGTVAGIALQGVGSGKFSCYRDFKKSRH
jgi:hypothetical protein